VRASSAADLPQDGRRLVGRQHARVSKNRARRALSLSMTMKKSRTLLGVEDDDDVRC
jgi:hypothetical protein